MDIVVLNMVFDNDHMPDFGSMAMDKRNEYLHLLGVDIDKLNGVLTKNVCINEYGAEKFSFGSGDVAFADDVQRAFVYNMASDQWYEWEI